MVFIAEKWPRLFSYIVAAQEKKLHQQEEKTHQ